MQPIIEVYAKLIRAEVKSIESVPEHLRNDVRELLNRTEDSS